MSFYSKAVTAKAQRKKQGRKVFSIAFPLRPLFFLCAFAVTAFDEDAK